MENPDGNELWSSQQDENRVLGQALKEACLSELAALPEEAQLAKELSFSENFEQEIRYLYRYGRPRPAQKLMRIPVGVRRVAVVLLMIFSASFTLFLAAPEVGASVQHSFVSWFDSYASFRFESEEPATDLCWEADYLPRGFVLAEHEELETLGLRVYENEIGERISLQYMPAECTTLRLDNEHSVYSVTRVNGREAYLFEGYEGYPSYLLWEQKGMSFLITSDYKASKELLKIAAKVQPVEE